MSALERLRRWLDPAPDLDGDADGGDAGRRIEPDGGAAGPAAASAAVEGDPADGPALGDDPEVDGPAIDDLDHRLDELEARVDRVSSSVEGARSSQADLADRLDEMDDRVRRLLGVYDRLTDGVNPLTGEGDAAEGEYRFGVVGDAAGEGDPSASTGDDRSPATEGDRSGGNRGASEATGVAAGGRAPAGDPNGAVTVEDLWTAEANDDVRAAADGSPPPAEPVGFATDAGGYATDLVIFEWLSMLIDAAGPAGALRAIDRYERMGWIDSDLRVHLETVLGGPALDADVDPREPGELTVTEHGRSYEYVRRLAVLRRLRADGGREA